MAAIASDMIVSGAPESGADRISCGGNSPDRVQPPDRPVDEPATTSLQNLDSPGTLEGLYGARRAAITANGADERFERVYSDHAWSVYGFLAYRLGDRQTTEDLTQATFERALRAWSRFDPRRGSERTWLLAIARNLLIDHHSRDRAGGSDQIDERLLPTYDGPEEQTVGSPELTEALGRLSDREREILALRFGGDLSGPQIAELLDLTLANVQQITSRSLRRLRELLEPAEGTEPGGG
jgi:RNA polymerase sigma factor (sigma-70 family)